MIKQFSPELLENSTKPLIVKAFATWCPHCIRMKPIYEQLSNELDGSYIFSELDVDQSPEFAALLNVETMPTFIFINNQEEVGRAIGEMPLEELKAHVQQNLG